MPPASGSTRHGLSLAIKKLLAKILCHHYVGCSIAILYRNHIPSGGLRFYTGGDVVAPTSKATLFWGLYESAEVRFVRSYLNTERPVVELGSSLGVVSAHIAQRLRPGTPLVCVEANPRLLAYVERNVRTNRPDVDITVMGAAIDYTRSVGSMTLLACGDRTTTSRLASAESSSHQTVQVTTTTLADIVRSTALGRFTLVADIEGAEAGLFATDVAVLDKCDQLIIELHDTTWSDGRVTVADMTEWIVNMGFSAIARHGNVFVFDR